MKTLILIALFTVASFAQEARIREAAEPYCHLYQLRDAKTYFVIHNLATPAPHREKIEKAMDRASDIKRAETREKADFVIDFTGKDQMSVWRNGPDGTRIEVGSWPLADSSVSMTTRGSARTTVMSAGQIATARTVVTPPRQYTIDTPGDVGEGSQFLFELRATRKLWRKLPDGCNPK